MRLEPGDRYSPEPDPEGWSVQVFVFEGSLTIQRGDFSIGEGAWKAFDIVANDVVIKFRITAAAK